MTSSWLTAKLSPRTSQGEPVTLDALREELQAFAFKQKNTLREELADFAATFAEKVNQKGGYSFGPPTQAQPKRGGKGRGQLFRNGSHETLHTTSSDFKPAGSMNTLSGGRVPAARQRGSVEARNSIGELQQEHSDTSLDRVPEAELPPYNSGSGFGFACSDFPWAPASSDGNPWGSVPSDNWVVGTSSDAFQATRTSSEGMSVRRLSSRRQGAQVALNMRKSAVFGDVLSKDPIDWDKLQKRGQASALKTSRNKDDATNMGYTKVKLRFASTLSLDPPFTSEAESILNERSDLSDHLKSAAERRNTGRPLALGRGISNVSDSTKERLQRIQSEGDLGGVVTHADSDALQSPRAEDPLLESEGEGGPNSMIPSDVGIDDDIDGSDEPINPTRMPPRGLAAIVKHNHFNNVIGVAISFNLLLIAVETDYLASATEGVAVLPIFSTLDDLFCLVFATEMAMRLYVYGWFFFNMPTWRWNVFDCIMTGLQVLDTLVHKCVAVNPQDTPILAPTLSIVRLLRVARAGRIVHMIKDLRILTMSILESMRPLGWIVLLLSLMTLMFSILLTMIVAQYRLMTRSHDPEMAENNASLAFFFGSIERSMMSLYQMITDGIHWSELVDPLRKINPCLTLVFSAYVALTVLAMMNIITGIFVDSVMRTTEQTKKRELIHQMKILFEESDLDGSGSIDWEEFESQLENPSMQAYLKDIDLDQQGANDLFKLLDVEQAGEVAADDFISGCARLSGAAKAMDLAVIQHEQRVFHAILQEHADTVERSLSWLTDNVGLLGRTQGLMVDAPVAEEPTRQTSSGEGGGKLNHATSLARSTRAATPAAGGGDRGSAQWGWTHTGDRSSAAI